MSGKPALRREFSAVPVAILVSVVVLVFLVGLWGGPWPAAIVLVGFALAVIAGMVAWSSRKAHPRAADAPLVTPKDDAAYRILVIADDRWVSPGSIAELVEHAGGRPVSIFVAAPALESRVGRLTGDQNGYDDATRRLATTIDALRGAGVQVQGEVSSSDPLQAADDALRQFPADEIVFVTNADGHPNWLEDGAVALAGSRYHMPVKHISVS